MESPKYNTRWNGVRRFGGTVLDGSVGRCTHTDFFGRWTYLDQSKGVTLSERFPDGAIRADGDIKIMLEKELSH